MLLTIWPYDNFCVPDSEYRWCHQEHCNIWPQIYVWELHSWSALGILLFSCIFIRTYYVTVNYLPATYTIFLCDLLDILEVACICLLSLSSGVYVYYENLVGKTFIKQVNILITYYSPIQSYPTHVGGKQNLVTWLNYCFISVIPRRSAIHVLIFANITAWHNNLEVCFRIVILFSRDVNE